jgi:hypothetical protein
LVIGSEAWKINRGSEGQKDRSHGRIAELLGEKPFISCKAIWRWLRIAKGSCF